MNFDREDAANEDELNDILWIAIKGGTQPPAPVRSFFSR
jgi:hypothetical protein